MVTLLVVQKASSPEIYVPKLGLAADFLYDITHFLGPQFPKHIALNNNGKKFLTYKIYEKSYPLYKVKIKYLRIKVDVIISIPKRSLTAYSKKLRN